MSSHGILEQLFALNSGRESVDDLQATKFVRDQEDPLIAQLNNAVAEMSGLSRQRILLAKILEITSELSATYLLFRKGQISRSKYLETRLTKERKFISFIGEQLFKGDVYESGSSLQFIQMARAMGFLMDNDRGKSIDFNVLKKNGAVYTHIQALFSYLQELGLPESYLPQLPIPNTDWNEVLTFLVTLQKKVIKHLSTAETSSFPLSNSSTADNKQVQLIRTRLNTDLRWLYEQYVLQQTSFPSGLQLLMMKNKINKKYKEAKLEERTRLSSHENLFFEAELLGYRQDITSNLFRKDHTTTTSE